MASLQTTLYQMVHGSKKSVDMLADEVGVAPSTLYRMVIEGESAIHFPLKRLVPLMLATGCFEPLRHLAALCGFLLVPLPRVRVWKRRDARALVEAQARFSAVVSKVSDLFAGVDGVEVEDVTRLLRGHLGDVAALTRAVDELGQGDLFEEE